MPRTDGTTNGVKDEIYRVNLLVDYPKFKTLLKNEGIDCDKIDDVVRCLALASKKIG